MEEQAALGVLAGQLDAVRGQLRAGELDAAGRATRRWSPATAPAPRGSAASGSSPGRRSGGGSRLMPVVSCTCATSASRRSARVHPVRVARRRLAVAHGIEPHGVAAVQQRPEPLVQGDGLGQLRALASVERRARSTPRRGGRTSPSTVRNASECTRPVVCERVGPMCAPITSGGISIDAPHWMVCRSSASLQSLVHTRSVRRRISWSMRAPPLLQLSISTPGWRARSSSSEPIERQRLAHACPPRRRHRCPARGCGSCPTSRTRCRGRAAARRAGRARAANAPGWARSSTSWLRPSTGS